MNDDGDLKDDVRMPDGEIGDKIQKLFKTEEKDTSKFHRLFQSRMRSAILHVFSRLTHPLRRCCPHLHG